MLRRSKRSIEDATKIVQLHGENIAIYPVDDTNPRLCNEIELIVNKLQPENIFLPLRSGQDIQYPWKAIADFHLWPPKSNDRINCLYETNDDERNKIRKNLKENKSEVEEEMTEAKRSQIHYYENCLIHNRIPFADIRAAFDTAAESVFGT